MKKTNMRKTKSKSVRVALRRSLTVICAVGLSGVAWAGVTVSGKNITVSGSGTVAAGEAEVQVNLASDADLRLVPTEHQVTVCSEGGKLTVCDTTESASWQDKVAIWLDASCAESLGWEKSTTDGSIRTATDPEGNTYQTINRWYDRRMEQRTGGGYWFGYNNRGKNMPDGTYAGVMPYVVTNGCNGLSYVSMGAMVGFGRRLPFIVCDDDGVIHDGSEGSAPPTWLNCSMVMMVFGSEHDGGQGVIAPLPRASLVDITKDTGIFDTARPTWVNGVSVDPTQTGLNGSWQILTFTAEQVCGLGFDAFGGDNIYGGQSYAEVLIFTNVLTEAERVWAERYLAKKWGIPGCPEMPSADIRLFGTGEASVQEGVVRLGGEFDGTLTVANGATVTFADVQTAPSGIDWITTGGTDTLWFDTDRADLSEYTTAPGVTPYNHNLSKLKNQANQSYYPLCGGQSRGTFYVDVARGLGPVRRWYDYRKSLSGTPGNTSRFVDNSSAEGNTFDTKTGFMVLDTTAGGGTPFIDTSVYDGSYLKCRTQATDPVFIPQSGHESLVDAPAYLNGVEIDPGVHAYNGRPEVLSFSFDESVPVKCFGAFGQTTDAFELRHGEVILTSRTLTDAQRKDTEAYLMKKWIGITPEGYGDASKTVVAGAGAVVLPKGTAKVPDFADAFTGSVAADGRLAFSVSAAAGVVNALELPNGVFDAGDALTVDVAVDGRLDVGRHTLIEASEWKGAEPVLGTLTQTADSRRTFALVREGGCLYLEVRPYGMVMIFR